MKKKEQTNDIQIYSIYRSKRRKKIKKLDFKRLSRSRNKHNQSLTATTFKRKININKKQQQKNPSKRSSTSNKK